MAIQLQLGLEVIRSYKRLSYSAWHALAEFVDNSTRSYFDNREALDEAMSAKDERLRVDINYDRDKKVIRIGDNAMGMDLDELTHALHIGSPPLNTEGRSEFGLGLKTAASWLGDSWSVTTKKLGETTEYHVEVDVESVASGDNEVPLSEKKDVDRDLHYTIIEIRKMHSGLAGRTQGKIKDFLRSMYRVDIRDGMLDLYWQGEKLKWQVSHDFLRQSDGSPYRKDFTFTINDKDVGGWIGVLAKGGRPKAGFAVLRRGRVIKGYPDAWRPQSLFGQFQGSNDLVNQRLVGEVQLNDFQISHTKDAIVWEGDEEEEVLEELRRIGTDYKERAKSYRKSDDVAGPSELDIQSAASQVEEELESPEMVDVINLQPVPSPEAIIAGFEPLLHAIEDVEQPTFRATIGAGADEIEIKLYLTPDTSPNDPYVWLDAAEADVVIVVVNRRHPHFLQLRGSEGVANYFRHCIYDGVAEWLARRRAGTIDPSTTRLLKDRLLRVAFQMESRMAEPELAAEPVAEEPAAG